jgi:excisionase family DNA binding protein
MHSVMFSQHDTSFQPQLGRSVTIDQAAQLLGVSRRTVYNRIREGRLRTVRTLGGSQRVLVDSLQEFRVVAALLDHRSLGGGG